MFVIARRKGQRISIGNDIEVVVTELSRSSVKLGIVAPRPCLILRGEVRDHIAEANRAALTCVEENDGGQTAVSLDGLTCSMPCSQFDALVGTSVKAMTPGGVKSETEE